MKRMLLGLWPLWATIVMVTLIAALLERLAIF